MSLLLSDYDYPLPESLIAAHPLPDRAASRMMVLHRGAQRIEHRMFADFPGFLQPGDLAILNDTKVIPARAFSDDGRMEFLFLEPSGPLRWLCMCKPGRKLPLGATTRIGGANGIVQEVLPTGERLIEFDQPVDLDRVGQLPIPPYLGRPVGASDTERYQTVYARHPGAVAAPTAGLHFTPELLAKFNHAFVTLHVGLGTFRPVKVEFLADHEMHEEVYSIPEGFEAAYEKAKRVIAVGTTSARVLEASANLRPGKGRTHIFIHPPFEFRRVDALLTNFHLPHSTLLMLVSALVGREKLLEIYREAIAQKYRFFSYGDAMLIL